MRVQIYVLIIYFSKQFCLKFVFLKDSFLIAYNTRFYLMKKIILLGYMGSGKSSVGALLAKMLNQKHLDLDQYIAKKEGLSILELFQTKGELYFRKLEHQILAALLVNEKSFILSTGGGTPCYYNNHLLLEQNNINSIYLQASINTLSERLQNEKQKRPLIKDLNSVELKEFIGKHLFERSYFYHKALNKVNIDAKSITQIVAEIKTLLF